MRGSLGDGWRGALKGRTGVVRPHDHESGNAPQKAEVLLSTVLAQG